MACASPVSLRPAASGVGDEGCALGSSDPTLGAPGKTFAETMEETPAWVQKECGAFSGEKKKWIGGVGGMEGANNLSLCRTTAMARGRTEFARKLNLRVKALIKDYQRSVTGGGAMHLAADDEQYAADVAKQVTDISLPGTRVEDMWFSEDGHCFALMVLDVEGFREAVAAAAGLDRTVRGSGRPWSVRWSNSGSGPR